MNDLHRLPTALPPRAPAWRPMRVLAQLLTMLAILLAATPGAAQPAPASGLSNLAWAGTPDGRVLFSASHQGKPVTLLRSGLPGKGSWQVYTGPLNDRVRLTFRDGKGLQDILALDHGQRITLHHVEGERIEYRLYGPDRRFIAGAVLFRDGPRWLQGVMKTEAFAGYAALLQVSDLSKDVNAGGVPVAPRASGAAGLLAQWRSALSAWPTWWRRDLNDGLNTLIALLLPPAQAAESADDLIKGLFSASARDAREFFNAPSDEMLKGAMVGAGAFTLKLLTYPEVFVETVAVVSVMSPFLVSVGAGVAIGLAADAGVRWVESKNLGGTASMRDLYDRLTRKTNWSDSAPPLPPSPQSGAGGSSSAGGRASSAGADFKDLQAMADLADKIDRMDFDNAIETAMLCRRDGKFACADTELKRAAQFAHGARDRLALDEGRTQLVADMKRVADEAARREEQQRLASAAQQREREQANDRAASGGDTVGRAVFGLLGAAVIGNARGVLAEDRARIASGFLKDVLTDGQGANIRAAEEEIRNSRGRAGSGAGAAGTAARGGSGSSGSSGGAGGGGCPSSGLRMITNVSEIPSACSAGRENNYAYSDKSEAQGATADYVCQITRNGSDVRSARSSNVSGCFCGKRVFKFAGEPQEMTCWVFYDKR